MRIAYCLSGQPRFIEQSLKSLKENVLDYHDCDVFVHTWFDENRKTPYDSSQPLQEGKVGNQHPNTIEIIQMLANPIKLIHEPQKDFSEMVKNFRTTPTAKQSQLASMFYSMKAVSDLKDQYEKEHNFEYDCVVRARLDLVYFSKLNLDFSKEEMEKYIYAPAKWQDIRMGNIPGLGDYTMNDCFNFSSSENMRKLFSVFDHLQELNTFIHPPFGENYMGYLVRNHYKIKVKSAPVEVEIAQRIQW